MNTRRLGLLFGVLAAILIGLAGLADLGQISLARAMGPLTRGLGLPGSGFVELALALITLVLAGVAAAPERRFELFGGLILVVLVVVEAAFLGFSGSILTTLGAVCAAISGILFLVAPGAVRRLYR